MNYNNYNDCNDYNIDSDRNDETDRNDNNYISEDNENSSNTNDGKSDNSAIIIISTNSHENTTVDVINPALPLTSGNYGIFLIMGNAGFIPSTVVLIVMTNITSNNYNKHQQQQQQNAPNNHNNQSTKTIILPVMISPVLVPFTVSKGAHRSPSTHGERQGSRHGATTLAKLHRLVLHTASAF